MKKYINKKILIGSQAIKYYFSDFPREPKDYDYIIDGEKPEWTPKLRCSLRVEYHRNPILEEFNGNILPPTALYTLKISHMFWDIKWDKHMFDVVFLTNKGCQLDHKLFWKLYAYWEEKHGKRKTSDLSKSTEDFFNNALKKYDHDYLHTLINPNPLYKLILENDGTVGTSQDKWNMLPKKTQLELIREEIYVMAFERLAGRDYRTAYVWQLKQLILHHLPIWQALFAIQNYNDLRKPIINYKEKIENEI